MKLVRVGFFFLSSLVLTQAALAKSSQPIWQPPLSMSWPNSNYFLTFPSPPEAQGLTSTLNCQTRGGRRVVITSPKTKPIVQLSGGITKFVFCVAPGSKIVITYIK